MKNRVVISESELVNLINKVINEAESGEFNEGLSPCAPVSCQQGLYQAPSNHPTHPCKCVRKGQLLPKKKPNGNRRSLEMREYDNPFSLPGSGSGPNWLTQQANWANFDGTPATAPSPPQAFLNRMSQMSCNRKNMRYMALINKWSNTAGGHGGGFSSPTGTINPNNPRWQSILASKIIWLQNDLNQNCP